MKVHFRILFTFLPILFCSTTAAAQWMHTSLDSVAVNVLAFSGNRIFAGSTQDGLFVSTDDGNNWSSVNAIPTESARVSAIAAGGTDVIVSTYLSCGFDCGFGNHIFLSTNSGVSWEDKGNVVSNNSFEPTVSALAVDGMTLVAGTDSGAYVSTDTGSSWTLTSLRYSVGPLAVRDTNLFAATGTTGRGASGLGIYLSPDKGANWKLANTLQGSLVLALTVNGANIFAGTDGGGVIRSTNDGSSWEPTGLDTLTVEAFAAIGTNLFAGTPNVSTRGHVTTEWVYLSTDGGASWITVGTGLTGIGVSALAASGDYLFAGTSAGVWRRPMSEMITSVENVVPYLPRHFGLKQNYPNPFNPLTTISFELASKTFVSLKVFDALGREVSNLISNELSAGAYSLQWNGESLSSGVYLYRLQAGAFTETKKLLLLK